MDMGNRCIHGIMCHVSRLRRSVRLLAAKPNRINGEAHWQLTMEISILACIARQK